MSSSSCALKVFLLLLILAVTSPTTSLEATNSRHLKRQVATATVATTSSLILPSIPRITIDVLQPPYVSIHSNTARDAQAAEPTAPLALELMVPIQTISAHGTSFSTIFYQITNFSSALHHWTEVPLASSASCFTLITNSAPKEWDCTAICGASNEDGECNKDTHCLDMGDGKGKGGRPSWSSSADKMALTDHLVATVMVLVVGVWMLL